MRQKCTMTNIELVFFLVVRRDTYQKEDNEVRETDR